MIPLIFKTPKDAVHVDKESGTSVDYHIFDEYEIHVNQVMPHTTQEWHSHAKIIETLFVTKGKLLCRYLKDTGEEESRYLEKMNWCRWETVFTPLRMIRMRLWSFSCFGLCRMVRISGK